MSFFPPKGNAETKNIEAIYLNQGTSNCSQISFCTGLFKNLTLLSSMDPIQMFLKIAFHAVARLDISVDTVYLLLYL
jgi:hypothetical protein